MYVCTCTCAHVCVHVYMCMHAHVCLCICVCACTHACAHALIFCGCLWRSEDDVKCHFQLPLQSIFWERLSRSPCIRLDWPASEPRDSLLCPSAGAPGIIPRFLCGHCGSELRSPWLHSNSPTIPDLKLWLVAKIKAKWELNLLVVQLTLKNAFKQN